MCNGYIKSNYPPILLVAYGLGLAAAVCFALFLFVPILMGIIFNIMAR